LPWRFDENEKISDKENIWPINHFTPKRTEYEIQKNHPKYLESYDRFGGFEHGFTLDRSPALKLTDRKPLVIKMALDAPFLFKTPAAKKTREF